MIKTIKRYPNRKLYDTDEKQYITLEDLAAMIRAGLELRVVDHASGEDLTAVALTQIIFEQEKKRPGFLPLSLLSGLVKASGNTLEALQRTVALPIDLGLRVNEEIEHRLAVLIERAELTVEDGSRFRELLFSVNTPPPAAASALDRLAARYLSELGIPTRDDYHKLLAQLDDLAQKIEEIRPGDQPGGKDAQSQY